MNVFHQPPIFVNMAGPDDNYTVAGGDGGLLENAFRYREAEGKVEELRRHLYGAPGKSFQDYLQLCRELFDYTFLDFDWSDSKWKLRADGVALWKRAKNLLGIS